MRVGWKVHRLTKKECHSNETWHALNSTFPDTNCIACFQINPHWISNSGLWKVVLETFQNGLENWQRESYFTRDNAPAHKSVVAMAAALCMTVALNWLITLHILLIWHHLIMLCSPTWKNTWLGSSIRLMMRSCLQLRIFLRMSNSTIAS